MKGIKSSLIVLTALIMVFPATTLAYSTGPSWFRIPGTIKTVDIDPIGQNLAQELAIRNAMSSWSNAGAEFYYIDNTTSGNNFGYYYDGGTNTLAYNYIEQNWLGYITSTYVRVNTAKPWATDGNGYSYDFESMAVHELGHGLRLNGSSETEATMYESMGLGETKKRSLHSDDNNGINAMY